MELIPPSTDTDWQIGVKGRSNNLLLTGDPCYRQKQAQA
jgi:hypothetical protein